MTTPKPISDVDLAKLRKRLDEFLAEPVSADHVGKGLERAPLTADELSEVLARLDHAEGRP